MRSIIARSLRPAIQKGFCTDHPNGSSGNHDEDSGTYYTNWILARSAGHNHNIEHMKRKNLKDRYSIHKLTNLSFMCDLVIKDYKYSLTLNQKIVLLAQMVHVIQVTNKNLSSFNFHLSNLCQQIEQNIFHPDDLICVGTYMAALTSIHFFFEDQWILINDSIMAEKYDESYDEIFGIYFGLHKYRKNLLQSSDFLTISSDQVAPKIPIIYRNNLQLLRQYITYNIYNIKECKIIFEALYYNKINEGFFWKSIRDWFNIYTKEQLVKKDMEQFFIMKESSIEKVLYDGGMIRPRPILQQLTSIVYILSENGYVSYRFLEFAQDLILYSIQNGSQLFTKFQSMNHEKEEQLTINLNEHIKLYSKEQEQSVKEMQKQYKTIFVNPIEIQDEYIVFLIVIFAKYQAKTLNKEEKPSFYDKNTDIHLDSRVIKWVLLQLVKPTMKYTVTELLLLFNHVQFLQSKSKLNLIQFVVEKLPNLRTQTTSFEEMIELMERMPSIYLDKTIPLLIHFLKRNHPSQILKLVRFIQTRQWESHLIQFLLHIPQAVNVHERYYSFEENCYFLLFLLQNEHNLSFEKYQGDIKLKMQFDGEKEKLIEQIKIVTYTRGFKLTVDSYFHKILQKIDVVEFFEGGRA